MAILKRQLEEKEKLLATEQEDAAVAKSKLRELNKVWPSACPILRVPGLQQCCPWVVGLPPYFGSARGCRCDCPSNQCAL